MEHVMVANTVVLLLVAVLSLHFHSHLIPRLTITINEKKKATKVRKHNEDEGRKTQRRCHVSL